MHVEHDKVGESYICAGTTGSRFQASPTPEEVAAGLSEAQKACVLALGEEFALPPRGLAGTAGGLVNGLGLTTFWYADIKDYRRVYRLTPRGLAVQSAIRHLIKGGEG
jgi:hypothetical protein